MTLNLGRVARAVVAILVAQLVVTGSAWAQIRVVAVSGAPAPGGGVFSNILFGTPSLSDSGQVAFTANLLGTSSGIDDSGIFVGDGVTLSQVVREGQPVPGGDGTFGTGSLGLVSPFAISIPAINRTGQVVFVSFFFLPGGGGTGIFRSSGVPATLTEIVRAGTVAPGGGGVFGNIGNTFGYPALNNAGQVAFSTELTGTGARSFGLFRGDGTALTQIARSNQAAPDGAGSFVTFSPPQPPGLNDAGKIAFSSFLSASGGLSTGGAVLLGDGALRLIARDGRPTPDGLGTFGITRAPPVLLNQIGQIAFTYPVFGGAGRFGALFRGDGDTLTQIVRTGTPAPATTQDFTEILGFSLNDSGQIAFAATLQAGRGIFRSTGAPGGVSKLVLAGEPAPDGQGILATLGDLQGTDLALNNAGQVAFFSLLQSTTFNDSGLFLYDDARGLLQVARKGDSLLGSTITQLRFRGTSEFALGPEYRGLNNAGQVAFAFNLADGRAGIAIWTPPAPAPSVQVTVNRSEVRPGQLLTVGVNAFNPSGHPPADLYAGVLLPGGSTILFLSPSGAFSGSALLGQPNRFVRMQAVAEGGSVNLPALLALTLPAGGGIPPGTYQIFGALIAAGALADNQINPGDILAIDVEAVLVQP